jgi:hypothetical protein
VSRPLLEEAQRRAEGRDALDTVERENASFYNRTGFPAHDFAERWRRGEIEDNSENASLLIEALSIREALDRAGIGNKVLA